MPWPKQVISGAGAAVVLGTVISSWRVSTVSTIEKLDQLPSCASGVTANGASESSPFCAGCLRAERAEGQARQEGERRAAAGVARCVEGQRGGDPELCLPRR